MFRPIHSFRSFLPHPRSIVLSILLFLAPFLLTACASNKPHSRAEVLKLIHTYPPEERARLVTDHMDSLLDLSQVQYQQAYKVNLKYAHATDQILLQTSDPDRRKAQFAAMLQSKNLEMRDLFTDEQYQKYTTQQQEFLNNLIL